MFYKKTILAGLFVFFLLAPFVYTPQVALADAQADYEALRLAIDTDLQEFRETEISVQDFVAAGDDDAARAASDRLVAISQRIEVERSFESERILTSLTDDERASALGQAVADQKEYIIDIIADPSVLSGDVAAADETILLAQADDSGLGANNARNTQIPDTNTEVQTGTQIPDTGSVNGQSVSVQFQNPLKFGTVNELLTGVLGAIQAIMASLAVLFIVIGAVIYMTSGGNSGRIELAKNAIWAAIIGLALALAAPSFLAEIYNVLAPGSPEAGASALTLTAIILNVLKFLLSIVGILAVTMLVAGGLMYMLSGGDQSRLETGKKIVLYAIIGLVVALVSLVIVTQIANIFT